MTSHRSNGEARLELALIDAPGGRAFWARAEDGTRLRLAIWNETGRRGTVLLFPGRTEYIEKYGPTINDLSARGYAVIAIDWRGQGASARLTSDRRVGHVDDFAAYQQDVTTLIASAREADLPRPWFLIGHSMGGAIGLRALFNGLPVQAAAFSAPMWNIWLKPMPEWLVRLLASGATRLGFGAQLAPGQSRQTLVETTDLDANLLTTDGEQFARMCRHAELSPDIVLGGPSYQWIGAALRECRALSRMPSPDVPCVTGLGTDERIVNPAAIRDRMARWPSGQLDIYEGARHELMMERPEHRTRFLDAADALFRSTTG